MNNPTKTTFDRLSNDPNWKNNFDRGYEEFLLSEFLIDIMSEEHVSVRTLAKKAGVSPTTIQNIRSGETDDVKLGTLIPILTALNYKLKFEKANISY